MPPPKDEPESVETADLERKPLGVAPPMPPEVVAPAPAYGRFDRTHFPSGVSLGVTP